MSATNGLISNPALRGEGAATNRAYHTAGFKCDDRHEWYLRIQFIPTIEDTESVL
jgi:hypothetical protein